MFEQVLPWIGLGVLFFLCLPIPPVQKFVLEVSAWSLRLGLIALLAAGTYLWFRPGDMPTQVSSVLADFPGLLALLPERGSPPFALCLACWVVAALVPVLAMLEVTRMLAGWKLRRVRALTAAPAVPASPARAAEPMPMAEEEAPVGMPILRPVERRTAAATIASASSRPVR